MADRGKCEEKQLSRVDSQRIWEVEWGGCCQLGMNVYAQKYITIRRHLTYFFFFCEVLLKVTFCGFRRSCSSNSTGFQNSPKGPLLCPSVAPTPWSSLPVRGPRPSSEPRPPAGSRAQKNVYRKTFPTVQDNFLGAGQRVTLCILNFQD